MERLNFIAEKPQIFENELEFHQPTHEQFVALVDTEFAEIDEPLEDEDSWYYENQISSKKQAYFRMRYRGAIWPWREFHDNDPLSDDPKVRLNQFLSNGYWAPAVDQCLTLFEETNDEQYKTAAIFAAGLHAVDALEYSWGFIDPSLKNESGVRIKHFLIFADRLNEVHGLPMTDEERKYYLQPKKQFDLALMEIALQSPTIFCSYVSTMDPKVQRSGEYTNFNTARSAYLDLSYLEDEDKLMVVKRAITAAYDYLHDDYTSPTSY